MHKETRGEASQYLLDLVRTSYPGRGKKREGVKKTKKEATGEVPYIGQTMAAVLRGQG